MTDVEDMTAHSKQRPSCLKSAISNQINVLYALLLHDIKSRFFGSGIGFVAMMLWPTIHIVAILALNAGRLAPYGASMILYAATAAVPYIAANYIGRFILLGIVGNKPFLQYPIIKPVDLMLARISLEIMSNAAIVAFVMIGMALLGIDVIPVDMGQAALAFVASVLLGIGLGILAGVITMAFPLFQMIYVLYIVLAWVTCGITIDPELLPVNIGYYMSFNPVLHTVEWMRLAYYPSYHHRLLDRSYPITIALVCLASGLIAERLGRSFWTSSR